MQNMTAYGEVETAIRGRELEYALMLERQPGREMCVPRSGEIQVLVNNVDSQDMSARKEFGESRSHLAGATPGIKYPGIRWERIAMK